MKISLNIKDVTARENYQKRDRLWIYNLILRCVRVTIIEVEKQ